MNTALWIVLGLTVWSVGSVPLALVVGHALRRSDSTPAPAPRGTATPVLVV